MRGAWAAGAAASPIAPKALVETQEAWFRRRSLCAFADRHAACLSAAYIERIAVLDALGAETSRPPLQRTRATCSDAPWGNGTVRVRAPGSGALTIKGSDARILAVATPFEGGGDWTPHVAFTVDGSSIRLAPIGGVTIVCKAGKPELSGRRGTGVPLRTVGVQPQATPCRARYGSSDAGRCRKGITTSGD
jgi:hypothetical protein